MNYNHSIPLNYEKSPSALFCFSTRQRRQHHDEIYPRASDCPAGVRCHIAVGFVNLHFLKSSLCPFYRMHAIRPPLRIEYTMTQHSIPSVVCRSDTVPDRTACERMKNIQALNRKSMPFLTFFGNLLNFFFHVLLAFQALPTGYGLRDFRDLRKVRP